MNIRTTYWTLPLFSFLLVVSPCCLPLLCSAFQLSKSTSLLRPQPLLSSSRLFYQRSDGRSGDDSKQNGGGNINGGNNHDNSNFEDPIAFQRHMAMVRSLQLSYYTTGTSYKDNPKQSICSLEKSTGKLMQLPIYKSSLKEFQIPGRSQVLQIDNPIYTNMFESILYKPQPWCFGHLYTTTNTEDNGADNETDSDHTIVSTWSSSSKSTQNNKNNDKASVLGCLMNIADYRRLSDGRLVLLVHSMERFVVTDIVQNLPYPIVHGQILPDIEEMDPQLDVSDISEQELSLARAIAIQESVRYHRYEYDPYHSFSDDKEVSFPYRPWSFQDSLATADSPDAAGTTTVNNGGGVSKAAIAKVLPFCPFSKTKEPPEPTTTIEDMADIIEQQQQQQEQSDFQPTLEYELLHRGVLNIPPVDPDFYNSGRDYSTMSIDELEKHVWIVLNHFLITTKQPVSPVLLSLLPPSMTAAGGNDHEQQRTNRWPANFYLDKIATDLSNLNGTVGHDFVQVSRKYPSYRRQRRLSFSAAYVLEEHYKDVRWKTVLLSIPSTKQRLRVVLERFLQWQQQEWGEFQ